MKKIITIFLLICAYFFPAFVYAEENSIELKSITLQEKSDTCVEQTPVTVQDNDISLDLKMEQVGDYATYKIKIKNNSTEDLTIKTSQNSNSNYLKYTILENNTTIKKGEEKEITLKVEYVTKASNDVLVNGELEQAVDLTITEEKPILSNPKTGTIILFIFLVVAFATFMTIKTKKSAYLLLIVASVLVPNIVFAANSSKITIHSKVLLVSNDYVYTLNVYDSSVEGENSVWLNQTFPTTIEKFTTVFAAMNKLSEISGPFYLKHKLEGNTVKESYVEFFVTEEMANENPGMNAGTYALRGEATGTFDSNQIFTCNDEYYNANTDMCVGSYYESNVEVIRQAFGTLWGNGDYCYTGSIYSYCSVPGLRVEAKVNGYVSAEDAPWYCEVDGCGASWCGERIIGGALFAEK